MTGHDGNLYGALKRLLLTTDANLLTFSPHFWHSVVFLSLLFASLINKVSEFKSRLLRCPQPALCCLIDLPWLRQNWCVFYRWWSNIATNGWQRQPWPLLCPICYCLVFFVFFLHFLLFFKGQIRCRNLSSYFHECLAMLPLFFALTCNSIRLFIPRMFLRWHWLCVCKLGFESFSGLSKWALEVNVHSQKVISFP